MCLPFAFVFQFQAFRRFRLVYAVTHGTRQISSEISVRDFAYIICPNRESTGFARVIGKQPGVPDGFESSAVRLTA